MLTNRENGQSCLACNWDLTHGHKDDKAIVNYLQKWKKAELLIESHRFVIVLGLCQCQGGCSDGHLS